MAYKKNPFLKDFSWYFLGSFIPLLISFIKTPIFTRHFNKEEYGYLGLVSITFTYLGMLLFSWIGSCIWRYYAKYKINNHLKVLYSNLLFIYGASFLLVLLLSISWYLSTNYFLVKQLILYSFLQLALNQLFLFYMIVIRLQGKAKFYTIFQSVRALLSLTVALLLVFKFNTDISALVLSLVLIDAFAILFFIMINTANISFAIKRVEKKYLKELIHYGSAGLIINMAFLIITSSDRYLIYWFGNLESVGIYDQVYKISQLSIVVLSTIFFNTINPTLLKGLETDFKNSAHLISKYSKVFVIFGLPVITYISIFSKDIATIFLGEEFRVGYTIMPLIFLAAFIHGFLNFYELRLKFSNQLKKLSLIVISAALLNIVLNLIFISLYGYQWAAVTTTITYVLLLLAFHFNDKNILAFGKNDAYFIYQIILVLAVQTLIYITLCARFEITIFMKLVLGLLFVVSYTLIFKKRLLATEIPMNI